MKFKNSYTTKALTRKYQPNIQSALLMLIGLLVISSIFYFVFFTDFLKISQISIIGDSKFVNVYDVETLVKRQISDKNILFFDITKLSALLKSNFQGAKSFNIIKKLPNTVEIYVYERVPLLLIHNQNDELYMVDIDGYILGNVRPDYVNLPKLIYSGDIKIGYYINKALVPVFIDIQAAMDEHNLQMSSLSFNDKYTHMYLNTDTEIFIGNTKNKRESIQIISDLLKQFKLDGKSLKKIDLRYDKVIVE